MLFNSIEFLIFFPIVTLLYFVLPHKYRWIHLLAASCIFYMFFIPQYILILASTIIIDYIAGIWIEKTPDQKKKKRYLILSIVFTCLVLVIFKYLDFFHQNMITLSHILGFPYPEKVIRIILPIGLSFHTFQSLSYVIEVYKGNHKAEKHFGIYSLYVMFFPQLVTGPIERPQNLLTQLNEKKQFQYKNIAHGLRLILFGLFVKMVIADNLATYVDLIYGDPTQYNTKSILLGLFFYSFQIYGDFFGYSTIAVGCAKVMGYNLMDNFKNPYLSKSIAEFWQRWHISLSTWFRDYVYFSLGGNRVKVQRWVLNIMIVFLLSGFWHGAEWTFIFWGAAHGVLHVFEKFTRRIFKFTTNNNVLNLIISVFRVAKTFILVSFIWVFFRSPNISHVKTIASSMIHNLKTVDDFSVAPRVYIFLGLFILMDIALFNTRFDKWCDTKSTVIRWIIYTVLIFSIIAFASVESFPFIYFQF